MHLGQFTDEHADAIQVLLDGEGITHWRKRSGRVMRVLSAFDWGTHLFVDAARLDDARALAAQVTGE